MRGICVGSKYHSGRVLCSFCPVGAGSGINNSNRPDLNKSVVWAADSIHTFKRLSEPGQRSSEHAAFRSGLPPS